MHRFAIGTAALLLSTTAANAGGLDRTGNDYGVLFEDGNYLQFGLSSGRPDVSGDYAAALGGGSTENMASDFTSASLAYKHQLSDQISLGFFLNQPYGADVEYTNGFYTGLGAEWKSTGLAMVLKYDISPNVSVYGGARRIESEATMTIPDQMVRARLGGQAQAGDPQATAILAAMPPEGTLGYEAQASSDAQVSYILGAAYERPEIALRVALTYESGYTHEFDTTESVAALGASAFPASATEIEMPEAITLDFQTGVAENTLLFGSVRHAKWSSWEVAPAGYRGITGEAITSIDDDVTSWNLGLGQRINESLSVFGSFGYEAEQGGVASRLAPTDGTRSIAVGASYTMNNVKLTGGVQFSQLGDTVDATGTTFEGNSAVGLGLTVGYAF